MVDDIAAGFGPRPYASATMSRPLFADQPATDRQISHRVKVRSEQVANEMFLSLSLNEDQEPRHRPQSLSFTGRPAADFILFPQFAHAVVLEPYRQSFGV